MRPPICALCHKDCCAQFFYYGTGGDWVAFADFVPLPPATAGHPQGLEWFCDAHLPAAKAMSYRTTRQAMAALQDQFGIFTPCENRVFMEPELWVTDSGPQLAKVFGMVHRATTQPGQIKERAACGQLPCGMRPAFNMADMAAGTGGCRCAD